MVTINSPQPLTRMPPMGRPPLVAVSDDECVARLARAVAEHDDHRLQEVAELIGRLAVPIE